MSALDDDYNRANDEQRARLMQAAESDGSGTGWTWDALASGLSKAAVQELRGMKPADRQAWLRARRNPAPPTVGEMLTVPSPEAPSTENKRSAADDDFQRTMGEARSLRNSAADRYRR